MKTISVTLKQYLKFILLTSPLFFAAVYSFNYVINQYAIADVRNQHARDIALNIGIAQRITSGYEVNSFTQEDKFKDILMTIANNFSKMPGVGCVIIQINEIVVQSPPAVFCENINITDTVTSDISQRGKVTFLLDDKYLMHLERRVKLSTTYGNLFLLIIFVILNYAGFHLTYKKQIDHLFVKSRRLFDQSPIPVARLSTKGLILETSAAWEDVFGDRKNTNCADIVTENDREKFELVLKKTLEGGPSYVGTFSLMSRKGTKLTCASKFEVTRNGSYYEVYVAIINLASAAKNLDNEETDAFFKMAWE